MTCNSFLWHEQKMPLTTGRCSCCRLLLVLPSHGIFHRCCLAPQGCLAGQHHRGTTCRAPDTIFPSSHPCSLQMLRPCQAFSSSLPSAQGRQKKGSGSLPQAADEDLMGQNYKPALKHQNSSQPLRAGQPRSERCSPHIEPVPSFVLSSHTTTLQEAAELG